MAVLGVLSAQDLRFAILAEDAKAIAAAPGIGSKTAQRVIIDLKDKIDKIAPAGSASGIPVNDAASAIKTGCIDAMTSLGYSGIPRHCVPWKIWRSRWTIPWKWS